MHHRRGFTIMELVVVIAVFSVIVSVVIASVGTARQNGYNAKVVVDVKRIQLAIQQYYQEHGTYPRCPNSTGSLPETCCVGTGAGTTCYLNNVPYTTDLSTITARADVKSTEVNNMAAVGLISDLKFGNSVKVIDVGGVKNGPYLYTYNEIPDPANPASPIKIPVASVEYAGYPAFVKYVAAGDVEAVTIPTNSNTPSDSVDAEALYGCKNSSDANYNSAAVVHDPSKCATYTSSDYCTDSSAMNEGEPGACRTSIYPGDSSTCGSFAESIPKSYHCGPGWNTTGTCGQYFYGVLQPAPGNCGPGWGPTAYSDNSGGTIPPAHGCTDPSKANYDASILPANDDGSCYDAPNFGCTDPDASNFNHALYDDGSCTYTNPTPTPDPLVRVRKGGCMSTLATNYDEDATYNDNSCVYSTDPSSYGPYLGCTYMGVSRFGPGWHQYQTSETSSGRSYDRGAFVLDIAQAPITGCGWSDDVRSPTPTASPAGSGS